jgi:tight adherence protein B
MESLMPMLVMGGGVAVTLLLLVFALSSPSYEKAQSRRLGGLKERHGGGTTGADAQMRKMIAYRPNVQRAGLGKLLPDAALMRKRIAQTGKTWTLVQYFSTCGGLAAAIGIGLLFAGAPILLSVLGGFALGMFLPHYWVGSLIKKRIKQFTVKFPEAIDLMVRGLRSGLPISETLTIVASELPGPVGSEFREVVDKIKIGKSMDEGLQEAADRLQTPEFQFFCITLTIQRETGGNLAETLSNLSDVLRKRAQMKLKIKAMSSEAKASAYIIGALPFIVFILVYLTNPEYIMAFFTDQRLMVAALGGLIWISIGAFIMSQMIDFEI